MPADESLRVAGTRLSAIYVESWGTPVSDVQPNRRPRESELAADLTTAARLGMLEQEMQYQQRATVEAFLAALARCRLQMRIVLTILIYFLVATFVSAMYLPIFSLGSAI
jgi:hypothetical protein